MSFLKLVAQWLILQALMGIVLSANILVVYPMPSRSHQLVYKPLLRELARRGHQLTVLTPFTEEKQLPNITEIKIPSKAVDMMSKYQCIYIN